MIGSFSGKSDVGRAEVNLAKGDAEVLELKVGTESKATYSIDYLNSISKAMGSIADTIQVEFSTKKPVRLTFALNSQGGQLQFFLAPENCRLTSESRPRTPISMSLFRGLALTLGLPLRSQ